VSSRTNSGHAWLANLMRNYLRNFSVLPFFYTVNDVRGKSRKVRLKLFCLWNRDLFVCLEKERKMWETVGEF
jgi:hypothetical protein